MKNENFTINASPLTVKLKEETTISTPRNLAINMCHKPKDFTN